MGNGGGVDAVRSNPTTDENRLAKNMIPLRLWPGPSASQALIFAGFGLALISAAVFIFSDAGFRPASTAPDDRGLALIDWLTIGGFLTGVFVAGSGFYFRLDEKRRKDRAEAREIHDRRRRGDDVR